MKYCIGSILKQTFKSYEIILVDDESTDFSAPICQKYACKYDFISFYQIPHSGAGAVRNVGLDKAQGQYILFLDADDYWRTEKLLEMIFDSIQKEVSEIVMFQMIKVTEDGRHLTRFNKVPFENPDHVCAVEDVYAVLVQSGQVLASACNKCIAASVLKENHIRFMEGVRAEDVDWALQLFSVAKTIRLLDVAAYGYRQHKTGSASQDLEGPEHQAYMIEHWSAKLKNGHMPNAEAAAGLVAFEYAICMGYDQYLSPKMKAMMRSHQYLLKYGMDKKTIFIKRMHSILGYELTCLVIRFYLFLRRIW